MENFIVKKIGHVVVQEDIMGIQVAKDYWPALQGLEGFSHLQIFWWFDRCDEEASRSALTVSKPYTSGPERLGTFCTRSPQRPNPLALSCAYVPFIDYEKGFIHTAYIDAEDGSPVLDIKPYTPSLDRVEFPSVPSWCVHWPKSCEESADFDWEKEFCF